MIDRVNPEDDRQGDRRNNIHLPDVLETEVPVVHFLNKNCQMITEAFFCVSYHHIYVDSLINSNWCSDIYERVPQVYSAVLKYLLPRIGLPQLDVNISSFNWHVLSEMYTIMTKNGELSSWDTPGRRLVVNVMRWGSDYTKQRVKDDILAYYNEEYLLDYIFYTSKIIWQVPYNGWIVIE